MIEVFKTNIQKQEDADKIIATFTVKHPEYLINFDLADCDKILRIKGENIKPEDITNFLSEMGYVCEVLN